ncbi:hypothetical protein CFP56_030586 [Quercus suber]|uniref:Uncharacterized protein n=1 Tax=Quercus suber TaxID=58331 RepID=A0AAW0LUE9_QUESU|nr:hypothetical protein CFP56_48875 [Quercus suber]
MPLELSHNPHAKAFHVSQKGKLNSKSPKHLWVSNVYFIFFIPALKSLLSGRIIVLRLDLFVLCFYKLHFNARFVLQIS